MCLLFVRMWCACFLLACGVRSEFIHSGHTYVCLPSLIGPISLSSLLFNCLLFVGAILYHLSPYTYTHTFLYSQSSGTILCVPVFTVLCPLSSVLCPLSPVLCPLSSWVILYLPSCAQVLLCQISLMFTGTILLD